MLDGKVAIVTGAARGIGLGIALMLGRSGAQIVLCDLDSDALETARTDVSEAGLDARVVQADASTNDGIEALIAATRESFGRIDILINNAGGNLGTPIAIEDVTGAHYDMVMDANLRHTFFCTKAVVPWMKRQGGGSVINMASVAGRSGNKLFSAQYSAAKAAIIGLTRNQAHHLGPIGIRVNAISPGFVDSGPRVAAMWRTRDERAIMAQVPLRHRGEIGDVAEAALFLASDRSSFVTGCVLDVTGGYLTA